MDPHPLDNSEPASWQTVIGRKIGTRFKWDTDDTAIDDHFSDLFQAKGPTISVAELARIVDVRIRGRSTSTKSPLTPEQVANEIESVLDLVEMCHWLIQERSESRSHSLQAIKAAAKDRVPTEYRKLKEDLEKLGDHADFETSLRMIGIPGDSAEERAKNFDAYMLGNTTYSRLTDEFGHHSPLETTEAERLQGLECIKKHGMRGIDMFWLHLEQFRAWWKIANKLKKRAAGKKSAQVKAAKRGRPRKVPAVEKKRLPVR